MQYSESVKFQDKHKAKYMVYLLEIIDKNKVGKLHTVSYSNSYNNFKDCRFKNLYLGLRSGTGDGIKCQPWKLHSQNNYTYLRRTTSNLCTIIKGEAQCSVAAETLKKCSIPFCEKLKSSISNNEIIIYDSLITSDSIRGDFRPRPNASGLIGTWNYDGFVVLFHNYHYECLQAVIQGTSKPTDYGISIRNFFISCSKTSHQINISRKFHFSNLFMGHIYRVYIFGVSSNKMSQVAKFVFRTKMRSDCFNDCHHENRYNGIRQRTKSNLVCTTYKRSKFQYLGHRWCQSHSDDLPWCYVKWNQKADCYVPKCSDDRTDMFCPDVNYSVTDYNSLKVEWSYPNTKSNSKDSILLLLYEIEEDEELCQQAILTGFNEESRVIKQVKDFYVACSKINKLSSFIHNYEFFYLKPLTNHSLYITRILDRKKVGFINKISFVTKSDPNILPECFEDCFKENSYFGIRSATINGLKCGNWKSNFKNFSRNSRVSNRCFAENDSAVCSNGKNSKDYCDIPRCETIQNDTKICFSLKSVSDQYLIQGTWSKPLPEQNVIGFVILLHNEDHECKESKVYGEIEPNDYSIHVRNFFISCQITSYSKNITHEYEFNDFRVPQKFTVYQFATFNSKEISKIQSIVYNMTFARGFYDCQTEDEYTGIRSATVTGVKCNLWKETSYETNITHNWCLFDSNRTFCVAKSTGENQDCPIPFCHNLTIQGSHSAVILLKSRFSSHYIEGSWFEYKLRQLPLGYVILLHNQNGECINSIVQGAIMPDNYTVSVRSFYISCQRQLSYSKEITYNFEFKNLQKDQNYSVYIFGTLSNKHTSKLIKVNYQTKEIEKGDSKHCFAHCETGNDYNSSLRYYVGKIIRCEEIKFELNCIKAKYKIKEDRMIEGTFSMESSTLNNNTEGFIILLYGASKCHSAIIYGSFKINNETHDPVIAGLYENCTDVNEYDAISHRFRFMLPLKQDEYTVFVIPILDENSYGYVTQLIIPMQYRTPMSEYLYGLVRAIFFIGMVISGFVLFGIKSICKRKEILSPPKVTEQDLVLLKNKPILDFLSTIEEDIYQDWIQLSTNPPMAMANTDGAQNQTQNSTNPPMAMENTDDAQNRSQMNQYFFNLASFTGSTKTTV